MSRLFQYAVIKHGKPATAIDEPAESDRVIIPITEILAASEEAVKMLAIQAIPPSELQTPEDAARLEVAVRPF